MIKHKRLEKGLTQLEVALKVGVTRSYISRFENKQINCVSTNFIINIADTLNLNPTDVFNFVLHLKRQ